MRLLAVTTVLVVLTLACGDDATDRPTVPAPPPPDLAPELEPESVVEIPAATSLRLIDAGSEPRHELRFAISPGRTERVRVTTRSGGTLTVDGRPVESPAPIAGTVLAMELTAGESAQDGAVELSFEITAAEPLVDDALPSPQVAQYRRMLSAGVGMSGTLVRDARGLCEVTSVAAPPGAVGPKPAGVEDSVQQSLDVLSVPLPPDAVGIGARWEVVSPQDRAGTRVRMSRTYELLARDGDRLMLAIVVRQQAAAGDFRMPGMNPNASARLRRLDADGTGRIETSLRRIVPENATLVLDGQAVFLISDQRDQTVMRRTTRLEFTIQTD